MTPVNGSLDPDSSCPVIEIEVSGPFGQPQKFTAMVDTGFSGFLSLPILKAFPLGLILQGTMGVTLADGSTHARLTARGMVNFDKKRIVGLVLLEWQNTDILVGMDFLTKFGKKMILCTVNKTVEIVDSALIPAPAPPPHSVITMSPTATDTQFVPPSAQPAVTVTPEPSSPQSPQPVTGKKPPAG